MYFRPGKEEDLVSQCNKGEGKSDRNNDILLTANIQRIAKLYIWKCKRNTILVLLYSCLLTLFLSPGLCSPPVIEMRVEEGLRVLLSCVQLSPRPCHWVSPPFSQTRRHNYDLEVDVTPESLGNYVCLCDEVGRDQPPCRKAEYQLTLNNPSMEGNVAVAGGRHFLASHIIFLVVGFIIGVIFLFFIYKRQGGMRGVGHSSSTLEKGRDLLPSTDTPQSPSSASFMSEAVPLTEKRNGTLNGHGMHAGGHNGRHIYTNSGGLKLQESAVNLAGELDGRERAGPDGEEEGLGDGLSEMEEEFSKLPCLRGAPLAQCEESSI